MTLLQPCNISSLVSFIQTFDIFIYPIYFSWGVHSMECQESCFVIFLFYFYPLLYWNGGLEVGRNRQLIKTGETCYLNIFKNLRELSSNGIALINVTCWRVFFENWKIYMKLLLEGRPNAKFVKRIKTGICIAKYWSFKSKVNDLKD